MFRRPTNRPREAKPLTRLGSDETEREVTMASAAHSAAGTECEFSGEVAAVTLTHLIYTLRLHAEVEPENGLLRAQP
jgi:hypothetical protein